jgi:hypothetical protein
VNKFRKLGLIDYNGHIEVHNSLLSAVLHDKPQLRENDPKETAPTPSGALFAELSLVDQTACRHTARLDAVVPNFSALEIPTPFRAGIFLSYMGSQIRHEDRRTTSRNHKNRSNAISK